MIKILMTSIWVKTIMKNDGDNDNVNGIDNNSDDSNKDND